LKHSNKYRDDHPHTDDTNVHHKQYRDDLQLKHTVLLTYLRFTYIHTDMRDLTPRLSMHQFLWLFRSRAALEVTLSVLPSSLFFFPIFLAYSMQIVHHQLPSVHHLLPSLNCSQQSQLLYLLS